MHNTSTPPVGERRLPSAVTEKIFNSELSLYVELHHVSGYRKKNFNSELSLYVELHHK